MTCNTPETITGVFAEYFCDMYKTSNSAHFDKTHKDHVDAMYSEIVNSNSDVDINLPGGQITEEEVNDIFKVLKRRKASGHDKIQYEHLLFGGHSVVK